MNPLKLGKGLIVIDDHPKSPADVIIAYYMSLGYENVLCTSLHSAPAHLVTLAKKCRHNSGRLDLSEIDGLVMLSEWKTEDDVVSALGDLSFVNLVVFERIDILAKLSWNVIAQKLLTKVDTVIISIARDQEPKLFTSIAHISSQLISMQAIGMSKDIHGQFTILTRPEPHLPWTEPRRYFYRREEKGLSIFEDLGSSL